jgi:hypothetical protein
MPNALDVFTEQGNQQAQPVWGDVFAWNGDDYTGTVSDLVKDVFFADDGIGKTRNAERLLEVNLSEFDAVTVPPIGDTVTYLGNTYALIEVESRDTTNIVWKIRQKMEAAT